MTHSVPVIESSQVAAARRVAVEAAAALGFDEVEAGRVAIVATELASNVLKHGGGGELLIQHYADAGGLGVELIALDRGKGIADLDACLQDGYSSAGSAGHGLGAIRRQSQYMEIASWPDLGTAVLARFGAAKDRVGATQAAVNWGAVCVPKPGEEVCGDSWVAIDGAAGTTLMVADGLGHGPNAAAAAAEAMRLFRQHHAQPLAQILELLHAGLRATRGAAISLARIDASRSKVSFGGVGNVAGLIVTGEETRRMISLNGTAGHIASRIQTFDYPYARGVLLMFSDGLGSKWKLRAYPGLMRLHPSLIAAVLYRDYTRGRDDVTVLAARGAGS